VALCCSKDRKVILNPHTLSNGLTVHHCPDCQGMWIPGEDYHNWRAQQPRIEPDPAWLAEVPRAERLQAAHDNRAALCPACGRFLARAKVSLEKPFYIERCPACEGIWCDDGEWEVLEKIGLHTAIDHLFSTEWQTKVRAYELARQERQAMVEKLGEDLAAAVFALADRLTQHPNGDFGVAYLMRRFER